MRKKVFLLGLIIVLCIASLTACNKAEQFFVFGTILEITADGVSASETADNIYDYMQSLENLLSPTKSGSDVYNINASKVGQAVKCNRITMRIFEAAKYAYEVSNGAYDPSVYPLVRLWGFSGDLFDKTNEHTLPTQEQIDAALLSVGLNEAFEANFDDSTITKLKEGAMLDFGGVAKGYAVAESLSLVKKHALVNLGGNIGAKGKSYAVGIGNPSRFDREYSTSYFAKFTLADGECVATSGDYERYYVVDGKAYHHIIDTRTGKPCDTDGENGVISCSVISQDGALSDAIATAVVVLGKKDGIELLERTGLKGVIIDGLGKATTVGGIEIEIK